MAMMDLKANHAMSVLFASMQCSTDSQTGGSKASIAIAASTTALSALVADSVIHS
jgi:hypothetical protein